ncbi:MAG: DUF4301 family protein [Alistipes sp.]|nr:DUF4301 family protein [Alistipes sp.]
MFTQKDVKQIEAHGLTVEQVEAQMANFRKGFPYLKVVAAASAGNGIAVLTPQERDEAIRTWEEASHSLAAVKFVPASGAASRMFKELFEFVNEDKRTPAVEQVLGNLQRFAFWPELEALLPEGADDKTIISAIIKEGLGYGSKPKGLVTFHAYPEGARKAVEEHLTEGAMYAATDGRVKIHFTVSPEHIEPFKALLAEKTPLCEARFGVKYDISFSVQKSSTDMIAATPDNQPFRTESGELLFRPAGHGALLSNLADIDADVIFIKNIDNVTTDARKGDTVTYKKMLAGMLVTLQREAARHLAALEAGTADLAETARFVTERLFIKLPQSFDAELLKRLLDRPMRVCGMVRNEGEPGGGPFYVENPDGTQTLQIAESSQISPEDMNLMKQATHFNPVDLVCGVRRADGSRFRLADYVDPQTGFISSKSSGGRELRAQELPGLWNGSMADWITVFADVPVSTFSPVKTVCDLLRPQHQ